MSAIDDAARYGMGITMNGHHVPLQEAFVTKPLPTYVCHKRVQALEIRAIGNYSTDADSKLRREIVFADPAFRPIYVPGDMFVRYVPVPGDYYVVYEDGYVSISPRKAFLEGYSLAHDGNELMERLMFLSEARASAGVPDWLPENDWVPAIGRVAREAYVTINSLKQQIERLQADVTVTRQMAGFKEVKREQKTDPDQSEQR